MPSISRAALARRSISFVALACAAAPAVLAQGRKLNAPLPRAPYGFVREVQLSPDGAWAVYADGNLYSVPVKGDRDPMELDVRPPSYVQDFAITPDSSRVVYVDGDRLEVVPIDGSAAPVQVAAGVLEAFELTPDGQRAVFMARGSTGSPALLGLRLDPRDAAVTLAAPSGLLLQDFQVSPDSRHVVYRVQGTEQIELFASPVDGSTPPVEVGPPISAGSARPGFRFSPDGGRVVFLWGEERERVELYGATLEAEPRIARLNPPLAFRAHVQEDFRISPDGQHVFYRAQLEGRRTVELYRAGLDGSPSQRLTPETAGMVHAFELAPGGELAVYLADQDTFGVREVYAVPADGSGAATRLSAPLVPGGSVADFRLAPDGSRLVYRADQEVPGEPAVYGVPLARPGPPVRLADSPDIAARFDLRFSPDGAHLVFTTRVASSGEVLHGVPADGSAPARVLAPRVWTYPSLDAVVRFVPGEPSLVCSAALEFEDRFELFRVALAGDEPARRLSEPPLPGDLLGEVRDFRITPDGRWGVYSTRSARGFLSGEPAVASGEVRAVSLDGRRTIVPLYPAGASGAEELPDVDAIDLSPDGRWVAISARDEEEVQYRLYAAPIDGHRATVPISGETGAFPLLGFGAGNRVVYEDTNGDPVRLLSAVADGSVPPVDLGALLPAGGSVETHKAWLDPTGRRVVFLFDTDGAHTVFDLYSAEVDGSRPPVRLNTATLGRFTTWLFSPDGERVVYTAAPPGSSTYEVYRVPIDGSAAPTRISPALPASGSAGAREVSPDGERVLLVADLTTDDVYDLLVVPITGGSAVQLNPPLVAGGRIHDVAFSPDSARVVYAAEQERNDVVELYAVPATGGAAVKLSPPLVAGGDVVSGWPSTFHVTADGERVVFRADAVLDERYELWSVPIGGGPVLRLNPTLSEGADVLPPFHLSSDGRSVLFEANVAHPEVFELFAAATDSSKSSRRVNGPLPAGGSIGPYYPEARFDFAPRSERVLYIASEETPEAMELFEGSASRRRTSSQDPTGAVER